MRKGGSSPPPGSTCWEFTPEDESDEDLVDATLLEHERERELVLVTSEMGRGEDDDPVDAHAEKQERSRD